MKHRTLFLGTALLSVALVVAMGGPTSLAANC